MIFLGYHTSLRQVKLQDAKISADTQENVDCLLDTVEYIMSSSSPIFRTSNFR